MSNVTAWNQARRAAYRERIDQERTWRETLVRRAAHWRFTHGVRVAEPNWVTEALGPSGGIARGPARGCWG